MLAPLTFALCLAVAPATERYELTWEAPATCPDADTVRRELDRRLADSPPSDAPAVRAHGRVRAKQGGGYELTLSLGPEGEQGRRTFADADCRELSSAGALIIAIAVDPSVLDRATVTGPTAPPPQLEAGGQATPGLESAPGARTEPAGEPGAEPGSETGASVTPSAEPSATTEAPASGAAAAKTPRPEDVDDADDAAPPSSLPPWNEPSERPTRTRGIFVRDARSPRPRSRTRGPLHVGVGAGAGVGLAVLPGPVATLELVASLFGRAWRAELGALYFTPREATSPRNEDVGGRFQLWALTPRGCGLPPTGPVEVQLCAGVEVGAIHGRGTGNLQPRQPMALRAAADLGAGVGWRPPALRGRLGLFVRGSVLPALTRARFGTAASGLVYRTPIVGGRVGAFVEVRLR